MANEWSDDELLESVRSYMEMLALEQSGRSYSKTDFRNRLIAGPLSDRSSKSIEFRMCNISSFRSQRGMNRIEGYRPLDHVGNNVIARIENAFSRYDMEQSSQLPIPHIPAYIRADETITTETRTPFDVDPDIIDRGLQAHRILQNEVADFAHSNGYIPDSPHSNPKWPNFDVSWFDESTFVVVEVKSLTSSNEVGQMRLGIGQVLDYEDVLLRQDYPARPVLAVEREPDSRWFPLCRHHGIRLVWPGRLELMLT